MGFSLLQIFSAGLRSDVSLRSRDREGPIEKVYEPGKTIRSLRQSDITIKKWHRWAIVGGLAGGVLGGIFIGLGVHAGMPKLLTSGMALAVVSYVGSFNQIAHAYVDPVAVDMLREAGLIGSEKVYCAFRNFEDASSRARKNNIILGCSGGPDRFHLQWGRGNGPR